MLSKKNKEAFWFSSAIPVEPISIILFLLFITYAILGLFGYGNDCDTYLMLRSGHKMLLEGIYDYSRPPGYLIPEIIIGGASLIGGHFLTNFISSFLGAASLYIFWRLLRKSFSNSNALLITVLVGLNPYFAIAASSSMDYVYSLFFGLLGVASLSVKRYFFAAALFAFAVSSRLSNILIIGIFYIYFLYITYRNSETMEMIRLLISGAFSVCFIILLFIPSFIAADNTIGFLTYYIKDWTFLGHLVRFVYKNIYLFGLFPCLFFALIILGKLVKKNSHFSLTPEIQAGLAILLVHELLFLKIPLEISYLLPLLFVIIPVCVQILQTRRFVMYIFLGLIVSYGFFVNPDILDRKYKAGEAISAEIGLFLNPGLIIADLMKRESSKEKYFKEYNISRNFGDRHKAL